MPKTKLFICILILCCLTSCTTVINKDDILSQAKQIKAAATATTLKSLPAVFPKPESAQDFLSKKEKLTYKAKYLGFTVGELFLINNGKQIRNGKAVYCFELISNTQAFFAAIFKIKDRYISYMDPETLNVVRYEEYGQNGNVLESTIDFDYQNQQAFYKNHITQELRKIKIPNKMLDILSGSYYLRSISWSLGDMAEFNLYTDDKVYNFIGLLYSQAQITMPQLNKQNAFLLKPYMFIDGQQITKISTEVFFSTAGTQKPLQALLRTPSGNVSLMLTDIIEDKDLDN